MFVLGIGWLMLTVLILVHMQRDDFLPLAFEAVSAFSSNGLSLGVTPYLTVVSKIVLLLTMLIGRVGVLALMLVMSDDVAEVADVGGEPMIISESHR